MGAFLFLHHIFFMDSFLKPEFLIFALTLLGVALFHKYPMRVALIGLAILLAYKLGFTSFDFQLHLIHEWQVLVNLLGLLIGFAILSRHFEESHVPAVLPNYLPDDWKGGFLLLIIIFILSSFLDNIAAAMIGGTIALSVFKRKVHIGYLAAIVAASNAGGAGSVVGDTTTTMMWIDGVSAFDVFPAYVGSGLALIIFGIISSLQQHKYNPIVKDAPQNIKVDWSRIFIVFIILTGAILTNVFLDFPAAGVWAAILLGALVRKTDWAEAKKAIPGSIFLLALVLSASMMPVNELPKASWQSTFALGFVSAVFDNIPLTKLALTQGGYDWGMLAYAVGFGGSMIWFGSSAGVALSNIYPEAKSVVQWIKGGWHVTVAYIIGFFFFLSILGWYPTPKENKHTGELNNKTQKTL
jgi:Na+/H+ antiporter NhaD/arsenite permease-like protein